MATFNGRLLSQWQGGEPQLNGFSYFSKQRMGILFRQSANTMPPERGRYRISTFRGIWFFASLDALLPWSTPLRVL